MHRRSRTAILTALGSLAALALPLAAVGQRSAEPFGRLEIMVAATENVGRTRLHDFWSVATGKLVRVGTPFYLGSVALTVQLTPFEPHRDPQPDIDVLAVMTEWNGELALLSRLRGFGGIHLSHTVFNFRHPETRVHLITESEVGAGVQAGLRARLAGDLELVVLAMHQRSRTHLPTDLSYLALGAEYGFATPSWFREFLR